MADAEEYELIWTDFLTAEGSLLLFVKEVFILSMYIYACVSVCVFSPLFILFTHFVLWHIFVYFYTPGLDTFS